MRCYRSLAQKRAADLIMSTNTIKRSLMLVRKLMIIALPLALALFSAPPAARSATPYEAQLGGRVHAILTRLIIGEFSLDQITPLRSFDLATGVITPLLRFVDINCRGCK